VIAQRLGRRFAGLWRNADFMKLWVGQTVSEIGSHITRDGLPLAAVLTLGASPAQMGLLSAIGSLPVVFLGLFAGVLADRMRRRPILIIADIGRALILATIPLAAILGVLGMGQVYIVAALAGALTVFFNVADNAFIPTLVGREHIVEANSKLESTSAVAEISGSALTGVLVQWLTAPIAIFLDALSFLFSALCIGLVRTPEPRPAPAGAPDIRREIAEGLRAVFHHPILRATTAAAAQRAFFGGFFGALYYLYAARTLGLTPAVIGLLIAAGGVGGLPGAILAGRAARRFGFGPTLIVSSIVASLLSFLVPLAGGGPTAAALMMLLAQLCGDFALTIYFVANLSLRQILAPARLLGRVNGSVAFLIGCVAPLGALAGGGLAELTSPRLALALAALGSLLSAGWLLASPARALRQPPCGTWDADERG